MAWITDQLDTAASGVDLSDEHGRSVFRSNVQRMFQHARVAAIREYAADLAADLHTQTACGRTRWDAERALTEPYIRARSK